MYHTFMIEVDDLVSRSFLSYNEEMGRLPVDCATVFEGRTRAFLTLGQDEQITEASFHRTFMVMAEFLRRPKKLFERAKDKILRLTAGREDKYSNTDIEYMAARMSTKDILDIQQVGKGHVSPGPVWVGLTNTEPGVGNTIFFDLPHPWYLDLQPYSEPTHIWTRGHFIEPLDMSLEDWIEREIMDTKPAYFLDAGTGSGVRTKILKDIFDDDIFTVGLGIENQIVPADQNVVQPMETLPVAWENKFDVIASNYALRYAVYPNKAISEVLRVLKPGKTAFLDVSSFYYVGTLSREQVEIGAKLIGVSDHKYVQKAVEAFSGLENYDSICKTIEAMSSKGDVYTVQMARGRDSSGYCVQVTKG